MPKKTKKEKILALYRKKLRLIENANLHSGERGSRLSRETSETRINKEDSEPDFVEASSFVKTTEDESTGRRAPPKEFFYSDLKKSIFLTAFIFALEFAIYFAKLIR